MCCPGSGWAGWTDILTSSASPNHAWLSSIGVWGTASTVPALQSTSRSPSGFQTGQQLYTIMNVALLWDIAPCSLYVNPHFREIYALHLQGKKCRWYIPPKYGLYSAISHKMATFITTAARTPDSTFIQVPLIICYFQKCDFILLWIAPLLK
jgi:hypothetical protein